MSILLDALKKSEEQRQLGSTPGIHSHVEGESASQTTLHQWLPLSMLALSAIVMAWIGWQQFQQPELPEAIVGEPVPTESPTDPAAPLPNDPGDPVAEQRTPVETLPSVNKPVPGGKIMGQQSQQDTEQKSRLNESFSAYSPEESPVPGSEARPEPDQETSGQEQIEPHISEPISYWEMPQGVRDNLPDFKITVMVYADNPEDRFLLINGQRLVEKEELQGGVVLDEIRRDGAVFQYRTYRFLVKG